LFGLDPILGGSITIHDRPFHPSAPRQAIGAGLALVPEDRRLEGLMMHMSVLQNTTLAALRRYQAARFVRSYAQRTAFTRRPERLALRSAGPDIAVSTLSGGNQQKSLLARWLLIDPEILFLDDPTRGIDVGARQDIYRIIDELSAAGKSVILVSSELPELLRCSDRILVLRDGSVTAEFDAAHVTQEAIM